MQFLYLLHIHNNFLLNKFNRLTIQFSLQMFQMHILFIIYFQQGNKILIDKY